jgi:hypothetical protein
MFHPFILERDNNDACDKYVFNDLTLWVEAENPAEREYSFATRYTLCKDERVLVASETIEGVTEYLGDDLRIYPEA